MDGTGTDKTNTDRGGGGVLRTERLLLRPLVPDDAAWIAEAANDLRIARNLPMMPHPYAMHDAEMFLANLPEDRTHYAIIGDVPMGVMSSGSSLGYWLGVPHWGKGYAVEAGRAVMAQHFATSDTPMPAGYLVDNPGSANVLRKLGFRDSGTRSSFVKARGEEVERCTKCCAPLPTGRSSATRGSRRSGWCWRP